MKIGVFDSGLGGLSVANAIEMAMPEKNIIFLEDRKHVPYGNREPSELLGLVMPFMEAFIRGGCQVIVIACNTVTTTIIDELRARIKIPIVAVEPMVKPAGELTKSGIIAVCATPATLKSKRYAWLKDTYAKNIKVLEPDCSDWAFMIEHNQVQKQKIDSRIQEVLEAKADVIVLACTHFHWIESEIAKLSAGRAQVIQPEEALIKELRKVLGQTS